MSGVREEFDPSSADGRLRLALVAVALLRLLSVAIGFLKPAVFKTKLFDQKPAQVSDLAARIFAVWTSVTCLLCVLLARKLEEEGLYLATLASFAIANLFFLSELLLFRTVSFRAFLSPGIVSTVMMLWLAQARYDIFLSAYGEHETEVAEDL